MGLTTVNVTDGSTFATLTVGLGRGPKGDGWTGGSYNAETGVVTFTSDDGLEFSTGDLRGTDGAGSGTVTSIDVAGGTGLDSTGGPITSSGTITLDLDAATIASLALADTATQPGDLATVATTGAYSDLSGLPTLGTVAATDVTDYATAAQGDLADSALQSVTGTVDEITVTGGDTISLAAVVTTSLGLADTAVQPGDLATVATTGAYSDLSGLPTLGTAAATDAADYATAAQGDLADSAIQPNDDAVLNSVQLSGGSGDEGKLSWNDSDRTLDLDQGGVVLQLGQELHFMVRNTTGSTIENGTFLGFAGVTVGSNRIIAAPFDPATMDAHLLIGFATEDIANGVNGIATTFGYARGLDTRGTAASSLAVGDETWAVGDLLYVHPTAAGKMTNVPPTSGLKAAVAAITNRNQTAGEIFVRVTALDENAYATAAQGALADSALQSVTGTVDEIVVTGGDTISLAAAVTTSLGLADSATQPGDLATVATTGAYSDLTDLPTLGTAAATDAADYATAAQGALADTALQPADLSGYALESYVTNAIAALVDSAPATLDTLNELAAALGDDPNFATTVSTQIGTKLDATAYTASDVLTKLLTVDGTGSGLDADLLDGQEATAFATAAQGALADTATQPGDLATVATTGAYSDLSGLPTLGTAAATDATDYATAAQGALADSAAQADDVETADLSAQTGTTYTLVIGDRGQVVTMNNASANTVTIPTNASVAFDVGSVVTVIQIGAGVTTIEGATGVTVNGTSGGSVSISAQYQGVSLLKIATNTWIASGAI
jgi:hypothetical protein